MSTWLSEREQRLVAGAEAASAATPIPTQIVSNGEYLPPPQSATQKKVEARINELADLNGKHLGLSRRQFLHTNRRQLRFLPRLFPTGSISRHRRALRRRRSRRESTSSPT